MKLKLLIGICIGIVGVASAFANTQVVMGTFNSGSSGNYRANPSAELEWVLGNYAAGKSTDGTWFGTFCIEKNEYFSPGSTYDVAINDKAVGGGVSSPTSGYDIISVGTAYLYSQFAAGTLAGFVYNNAASAASLQDWFWYLEDEQQNPGSSIFGDLLAQQFGNDVAAWKADYTGSAVKVLNLTSNQGRTRNQDQLVYVPDNGMTALLVGLGLAGIALARRKASKA